MAWHMCSPNCSPTCTSSHCPMPLLLHNRSAASSAPIFPQFNLQPSAAHVHTSRLLIACGEPTTAIGHSLSTAPLDFYPFKCLLHVPSALLRLPLPVLAHCCPCLSALHCSCLSAPSGTMEQQSATTSIFILLAHCNAYLHFSAVAFPQFSRTMEHQSSATKTRSKHQGAPVSANLNIVVLHCHTSKARIAIAYKHS